MKQLLKKLHNFFFPQEPIWKETSRIYLRSELDTDDPGISCHRINWYAITYTDILTGNTKTEEKYTLE